MTAENEPSVKFSNTKSKLLVPVLLRVPKFYRMGSKKIQMHLGQKIRNARNSYSHIREDVSIERERCLIAVLTILIIYYLPLLFN